MVPMSVWSTKDGWEDVDSWSDMLVNLKVIVKNNVPKRATCNFVRPEIGTAWLVFGFMCMFSHHMRIRIYFHFSQSNSATKQFSYKAINGEPPSGRLTRYEGNKEGDSGGGERPHDYSEDNREVRTEILKEG
jgi:hypothetical protein